MSSQRKLVSEAKDLLHSAGIEDFEFEAGIIAEYVLKNGGDLKALCRRRIDGEPLQYIIGEWDFYDLTFKVGKGVLIPRQDTETLIDTAIAKFKNAEDLRIIDLCAGTGCIGITLEKHLSCSEVRCVELYADALKYLAENKRLNASDIIITQADVTDEKSAEDFPSADLIVCNPPYLTAEDMRDLQTEVGFEPETALYGGEDGLDFYRDIVRIWKNRLTDGGMLMFEAGAGQAREIMRIMIQHGFRNVRAVRDLCGIFRAVYGTLYSE